MLLVNLEPYSIIFFIKRSIETPRQDFRLLFPRLLLVSSFLNSMEMDNKFVVGRVEVGWHRLFRPLSPVLFGSCLSLKLWLSWINTLSQIDYRIFYNWSPPYKFLMLLNHFSLTLVKCKFCNDEEWIPA